MKITAAVLVAPKEPFRVETLDLDGPREGEVLVKLAATGVCHSDWHLVTGATRHPMPVVPGHEGAGVVVEVGPNVPKDLAPGAHVILNWAPACGGCFYCLRHKPNLCETFTGPIWEGRMLDGTTRLKWDGREAYHWCGLAAFATHTVVPYQSLVPIRKEVPLAVAALVGCAVATGVGAVTLTAEARPADSVVVVGCGGVGLSAIQGAALAGASPIIAVDSKAEKEAIARTCGATHFVRSSPAYAEEVKALTGGRGGDLVVEAVGLPATQESSLGCVRPGGTLVLAGLSPMSEGTNLPGSVITRQEKTIKGSYYGSCDPRRDFPMLLDLYQAGRLPLDRLVSKHYRLEQINEAYAAMLSGAAARGVVVF